MVESKDDAPESWSGRFLLTLRVSVREICAVRSFSRIIEIRGSMVALVLFTKKHLSIISCPLFLLCFRLPLDARCLALIPAAAFLLLRYQLSVITFVVRIRDSLFAIDSSRPCAAHGLRHALTRLRRNGTSHKKALPPNSESALL